MAIIDEVKKIIEPSINTLGYDLWAVEYLQGKTKTLRVYIDNENGIILDDCVLVSENISPILDVEEPINSEYNLEVSSPGMNRELSQLWHYEKFIGNTVKIKLTTTINKKKIIIGKIIKVENNNITINSEEENINIDLSLINKANLVVDF